MIMSNLKYDHQVDSLSFEHFVSVFGESLL